MKRFILFTTGFALLFFFLHAVLYLVQLGQETESSRWIHEALIKKERAAERISGERLLIMSGSNALFSLDAQRITGELELSTVNLGIHAGLKIDYYLNRYLRLVRDGDIILMPLEYESYSYDGKTSEALSDFATSRDPRWITRRASRFINTAASFSTTELVSRALKRFRPDKQVIGFYDASYINSFGDKTNNDADQRTARDMSRIENLTALEAGGFTERSKNILKKFVEDANARGAKVLLTFPVTTYFDEYMDEEFSGFIDEIRLFADLNGVEILGDPEDFFLSRDLFFDLRYHATSEGRAIATSRLIELLRNHFESKSERLDGGKD